MILKSILLDTISLQQKYFYNKKLGLRRVIKKEILEPINQLVVVNGIKRIGKTSFLYQLHEEYFRDVFYINFEHPGLYDFDKNDLFKLDEIITELGNNILFFDEIANLPGWHDYVVQKIEEGYKVVLTASNTEVLNNKPELNLAGRQLIIDLFPFSLQEFCAYYKIEINREALTKYIKKGGMPENLDLNGDDFLSRLFDDIIVREIGLRFGVRDLKSFKRLAIHLLLNVSKLITGNQLKNLLGIKTTSTVMDYLSFLEAGFLMHYVPKFSYSYRKQMINPRKVYVVDTGFITATIFSDKGRAEQLLENLVFLSLRRKYKELNYFVEKYHCDFIVFNKNQAIKAVQVCCSLQQDNLDKELNGLYEAMDFFEFTESTLVTMNQTDKFVKDGKTINVVSFDMF